MTDARASNRETENEDLKPGSPPRPATEPTGSEGSARNDKTKTDPATGEQGGNPEDPGPRSLRDTPKVG